jgi:metal-responsive CopG/Arc/MetJ family transcriptional regulator
MRRTTITLPEELAGALEREARRRGLSISEVTRQALAAHLGLAGDGQRRRLPFAELGASGYRTTARDMEEILAGEWKRARRR